MWVEKKKDTGFLLSDNLRTMLNIHLKGNVMPGSDKYPKTGEKTVPAIRSLQSIGEVQAWKTKTI